MKVSIIVGKTPTHLPKKVQCNGHEYLVPFPLQPHNFVEIVDLLHISSEYETTLQILSKNKDSVPSVQEFYKVQSECSVFFGVDLQINHLAVALIILSQTQLPIKQLDSLNLKDLFLVFKQGYDGLTTRTHSKLERRLKKYMSQTQRSVQEKNQITKFVQVVKADSTDEQLDQKEEEKEKPEKKAEKSLPKTKKIEEPEQNPKEFLSELEKHEPEQQASQKVGKHHRKHHHGHRKSQDDEADWQDVEQEKINKKMEKKLKKKHLLEDGKVGEESTKPRERKMPDDRKIFSNYKEKQEKDNKVHLGILGDSDEGWRERYRMARVPTQQ